MNPGESGRRVLQLAALFGLIAAAVLVKSFLDSEGYLFDDSTQYMKLSRSLLEGRGVVTTPCNYESDLPRIYFAVWPVGYPVMIAAVSKLTGASVFLGSKFANLLCVALLLLLFGRYFGRAAVACAIVLLFAPFLEIFTFTMSEAPFILGLVWFCVTLHELIRRPDGIHFTGVTAAAFLVFLFRYIGAFSFGICLLLAGWNLYQRRLRTAGWLAASGLAGGLMAGLYLAHNAAMTGFPTGLMRAPSFFSLGARCSALVRSLVFLVNPMTLEPMAGITRLHALHYVASAVLLILMALYFRFRTRAEWRPMSQPWDPLSRILALTGCVSWAAVIVMHGTAQIDLFSYRLFAPGGLLFLLAAVRRIEHSQSPRVFGRFSQCLLAVALVAYLWQGPLKLIKHRVFDGKPTYLETLAALDSRYRRVPAGSAVIAGSSHLNYLRPDLRILFPYNGPRRKGGAIVFDTETLDQLIARSGAMPYAHVYLDVREVLLNPTRLHDSFASFAKGSNLDVMLIR